jgi:hypothetical protein
LKDQNIKFEAENKELVEQAKFHETKICELEKLVKVKNQYLEVRMMAEEVEDP